MTEFSCVQNVRDSNPLYLHSGSFSAFLWIILIKGWPCKKKIHSTGYAILRLFRQKSFTIQRNKKSFLLPLQEIEDYSFVTQLAGLTDHLSVAMRLAVSTGEEEPQINCLSFYFNTAMEDCCMTTKRQESFVVHRFKTACKTQKWAQKDRKVFIFVHKPPTHPPTPIELIR